ncbi:hypothetical protein [Rummeliibacillus stabekisii]|uniref:hypothetical protein n=1 Tax=Rummeliibacillus stabekisii TaxID=241244 RepID=UPI00116DACBD|nr:hypothetical protein [Rummeliibacillus stabekisii]MBB5168755.1 hypothetical protein [Rummeliibacillus stabekisii]GEL05106.1 hypothetical protein RST01_17330 [Rummeliibacillus stabekisii]
MNYFKLFIFIFIFIFSAFYLQAIWDMQKDLSISTIILSIVCIYYSIVMASRLMETTKIFVLPIFVIISHFITNGILKMDHLIK